MNEFVKSIEVRWADLDPNFHVRHSVYYDWGAYSRICFFQAQGVTTSILLEHSLGPILFREECIFRKEIHFSDKLNIDLQLIKSRDDYSRWSIRHSIYKNTDTLAAIITVDGAWIDTLKRKLAVPPAIAVNMIAEMPKSPDFEWTNK